MITPTTLRTYATRSLKAFQSIKSPSLSLDGPRTRWSPSVPSSRCLHSSNMSQGRAKVLVTRSDIPAAGLDLLRERWVVNMLQPVNALVARRVWGDRCGLHLNAFILVWSVDINIYLASVLVCVMIYHRLTMWIVLSLNEIELIIFLVVLVHMYLFESSSFLSSFIINTVWVKSYIWWKNKQVWCGSGASQQYYVTSPLQGGPERFTHWKTRIKIIPEGEWRNASA